jgi:hypothetical protein
MALFCGIVGMIPVCWGLLLEPFFDGDLAGMSRSLSGWLGLLAGILLPGGSAPLLSAQPADGLSPVASPPAMVAGLRSQLKVVQDWIKEKDFASAAQANQGLQTLTELAAAFNDHDDWRKTILVLQLWGRQLAVAIQNKNPQTADAAARQYATFLGKLADVPVKAPPRPVPNFKIPGAGVKVWMLLMDGAYIDAKTASSGKDLDLLVQTIAAEAEAVRLLRTDLKWRQDAQSVIDTALKVAEQARTDHAAARKALRGIYERCEACHDRSQKK